MCLLDCASHHDAATRTSGFRAEGHDSVESAFGHNILHATFKGHLQHATSMNFARDVLATVSLVGGTLFQRVQWKR